MSAEFHFEIDPVRRIVLLTLSGVFAGGDFADLAAARADTYRRLGRDPAGYAALIDVRGLALRSPETQAAFAALLGDRAYRSRRIALVVDRSPAWTRRQRELTTHPRIAGFSDPASALTWLLDDDSTQQLPLRAAG